MTLVCATLSSGVQAQKVTFRHAMELALRHSAGLGVALADQMKARQGYLGIRNLYLPQVTFGSGLAKTWGYPMSIEGSAPSAFNLNSQSYLVNFANREAMRAARSDWNAADLSFEEQRQATLLETAINYLQLDRVTAKLATLRKEADEATRLQVISRARLQEGVDSKLDVTRASLAAARLRLRLAEAQGNADMLRQRLAQLTGLDARELETDSSSIPPSPPVDQQQDLTPRALANSPAVKAAETKALAAEQRARSERRQVYPAIDLVGNYGLFTKYNNLDLLFPNGQFSRNNATFGVAIRVPFLNASQRSKTSAAEAEALRAHKLAEAARDQVASDTLHLQRSIGQLEAARDVAQLEQELAHSDVETAEARNASGEGTIRDQQNARIEAEEKQAALLDAQLELERARLQLLRATGDLEAWALP